MPKLTTKQLRENMPQVIHDLQNGKSVTLSYRHKVVGVLQPVESPAVAERRGSAQAIRNFLNNTDFGPIPPELKNPSVNFKQQIGILRNGDLSSE